MPRTKNFKQLSREEELEHFRRWREDGDRQSYEALVESQLPWARRLVAKMGLNSKSTEFDEMESLAYEGVLDSIRRFDPTRGVRLTTVVAWGVKNRRHRGMNPGAIHLPLNRAVLTPRQREQVALVSKQSSIGAEWKDEAYGDEPGIDDDPSETAAANEARELDRQRLEWALSQLDDRERQVISRRFYAERTLHEVGSEVGVTRERVRQIETRALRKMRLLLEQWNPGMAAEAPTTMEEEPVQDVFSLISRLSQGEIDREIRNLETQRDAAAREFDAKISKLTGLRDAMFGQKKAAKAPVEAPKAFPGREPASGSKTKRAWDLLRVRGPMRACDIAAELKEEIKSTNTMLSTNVGRWFSRSAPGTYEAITA